MWSIPARKVLASKTASETGGAPDYKFVRAWRRHMTRGKSQGGAREQSCSELRGGVGGILQVDKHSECVVYLYKYYKYPIVTFV